MKAADFIKRLLDIVAAGGGLIILSPVLAIVAAAVWWKLGAPVLFRQQRPGLHGEPFELLKFRTLTNDRGPDARLLPDEQRMTPFGQFLRSTSLDELPELWNVLRGEMSLVGPRPLLMEYLERYTPQQARRHEVRPGITGWAQIHGRNHLGWPERLRMDVWYVDHHSLWLDLQILWKTCLIVLRRDGVQAPDHATMPRFFEERAEADAHERNEAGVYVIGAGGHGKVVIRALDESGVSVAGVFDDREELRDTTVCGATVLGTVEEFASFPRRPAVIAIGDQQIRRELAQRFNAEWITVVHPAAVVDPTVKIGAGTVVLAGSVVQADAQLGRHVIINTGATVDHDCMIADFAHICPGVHLAGSVMVERSAFVGTGAAVVPNVRIGATSVVGAGAVVTRNVPPEVTVVGIPARVCDTHPSPPPIVPPAHDRWRYERSQPPVSSAAAGDNGGGAPPARPPRIHLSPPHMSPESKELLLDAFDSNWIAPVGPYVDAFEKEFAARLGLPDATALSSGTAALHLALRVLGVQPGDDVITSTLTFAGTANAISYVGARPIFIDSHPVTWNMDPQLLAEELESRARAGRLPKAVMVVDLYGHCADYASILNTCRFYEVPVIEDAAEALGATYRGHQAGTFGRIGCFSFNGNKIITTSGGGMLVSSNPHYAEQARFLASQAKDPAPHYEHSQLGYNYRLSNLLAAVGLGQLRSLEERIARRREVYEFYREALGDLPGITFLSDVGDSRGNHWLTCVTIDAAEFGASRDDVRVALERENIESRPVWKPMHLQPAFARFAIRGGAVAERLFERGLCLPSGSSLTHDEQSRVVAVIRATGARHHIPIAAFGRER